MSFNDLNIDAFQHIIKNHDIDNDVLINALAIVSQFIIDNDLIIVGGCAIDYALRLYGDSIYDDNDLSDYDCVSDKNVDMAYTLADILHNLHFKNVKVVRAKHQETMRIRIDSKNVADITYIPNIYFTQYKSLNYKNIKFLHPDIQKIDLHKSLCFPFNNAPMEDIFNRWSKDVKRFNLLEKYYKIILPDNIEIKIKKNTYTFNDKIIKNKKYALHGFAAYAIYYNELINKDEHNDIEKILISFLNDRTCVLNVPVLDIDYPFILVSDNYNLEDKQYASILGTIPQHDKIKMYDKDFVIYYVNMLSIVVINDVQVVNIQYLLMYFLFYYNFYENIEYRNIFGKFYNNLLKMIDIMEKKNDIFLPSLTFLGKEPLYNPTDINKNLPINYIPERKTNKPIFDYNDFKISGEKL